MAPETDALDDEGQPPPPPSTPPPSESTHVRPARNARTQRIAVVVFVCSGLAVLIGILASAPSSPAATVTHWEHGSATVKGNVTGGSSGCTKMHVELTLKDHNAAVQHKYDLTVKDVGGRETKDWQTEVSGFTAEPITDDITSVTATADCQDQH